VSKVEEPPSKTMGHHKLSGILTGHPPNRGTPEEVNGWNLVPKVPGLQGLLPQNISGRRLHWLTIPSEGQDQDPRPEIPASPHRILQG